MWWGKDKPKSIHTSWKELNTPEVWAQVLEDSHQKPQLVFKHSTRCSISSMVRSRLEKEFPQLTEQLDSWYLDLITYRTLSNQISVDTGIAHESPQVIILWKGQSVYNASHSKIRPAEFPTL